MAEISFDQVTKVYPDGTEAVSAVDLEIEDGALMVLVGPSGCGKTTPLRMVAGLEALVPKERPWLPGAGIDTATIPMERPRETISVRDGDSLHLEAGLIRRRIAGRTIVGYGFNGQSPGPLIRVAQAATIVVDFTNRLDQPTSVHWHGVRLDNGRAIDEALIQTTIAEETEALRQNGQAPPTLEDARALFEPLCLSQQLDPFLTLPAYRRLLEIENDISANRSSM